MRVIEGGELRHLTHKVRLIDRLRTADKIPAGLRALAGEVVSVTTRGSERLRSDKELFRVIVNGQFQVATGALVEFQSIPARGGRPRRSGQEVRRAFFAHLGEMHPSETPVHDRPEPPKRQPHEIAGALAVTSDPDGAEARL